MSALNVVVESESLPRSFTADFIPRADQAAVSVYVNAQACGDTITDNSYSADFYRYHDVFHLTYAARLGWSPCTRAMLRRKRKSNALIDQVEDGARAQITEEAIALMLFNDAKSKDLYSEGQVIDPKILDLVLSMCGGIESATISRSEWKDTILESFRLFRLLVTHEGGRIVFDADRTYARFEGTAQLS